jgi:putative ABC transport system ATP-binding protein
MVNQPQIILADEPTGNLDSHSGEDILREFQNLNQERGQTIIMVTHDAHIASYAGRQIVVRDGLIESDSASGRDLHEREPMEGVIPLPSSSRQSLSSRAR